MARRNGWNGGKWIRPERRVAIYVRDGLACVWCGSTRGPLTLDHLRPCSAGWWDHSDRNLVTACASCNRERGARTLLPWLRHLEHEWVDAREALARVRRARATPIDRALGRRLLRDPRVQSLREAADYRVQGRAT